MAPFIVFALPRSRTAWLARYLSYNGRLVGHDVAAKSASIAGFFHNFATDMDGTVETGAMMGWRLFREQFPEAPIAVIRRPIEDVKLSLSQFGVVPRDGDLEARDVFLDEIERQFGVLTMSFRDLYSNENRQRMFEHCLHRPWDPHWDAKLAPINIQIDVDAALRAVATNQIAIAAMKREVAARSSVDA